MNFNATDGQGQGPALLDVASEELLTRTTSPRNQRRAQRLASLTTGSWPSLDLRHSIFRQNGSHLHPVIPPKEEGSLRLLTLNVAHGRRRVPHQALVPRRTVHDNLAEIADALRRWTADVVALQEADGPSAWSGNFDHVATLAQLAELENHYRGEHNPFGMGDFNLASGTALLARFPLLEPLSHRFGMSWRDTKGFVAATVTVPEWGGTEVDMVSVHLDFLAPSVRRKQILHMAELLSQRQRPLVVSGDLNCCWHYEQKSLQLLTEALNLHAHEPEARIPTYPTYRPRRRLDWILISPQLRFVQHHTLPARLSDHLGVMADLQLR